MKKNKKKVRVQLDMPKSEVTMLDSLREQTDAGTRTAVILSSLRLYKWIMEQEKKGAKLYMKGEDGKEYIIQFVNTSL